MLFQVYYLRNYPLTAVVDRRLPQETDIISKFHNHTLFVHEYTTRNDFIHYLIFHPVCVISVP